MVRIFDFLRNVYQLATTGEIRNAETEQRLQNEIDARVQNRMQEMSPPPVPDGFPPRGLPIVNQPTNNHEAHNMGVNPLWCGTTLDKKLAMINLTDFNGSDEDWLKWSRKVKALFGGAGLIRMITSQQVANVNKEANERVYWLLEGVTANGAAKTTVARYKSTKSGYDAWKNLLITYEGDGVRMESAEKVRNRLDNLRLDTTTSALQYISDFQECISLLDDMSESYTASKTREIFLNQITDMDYQRVTHSLHFHEMPLDECYKKVRKCNLC